MLGINNQWLCAKESAVIKKCITKLASFIMDKNSYNFDSVKNLLPDSISSSQLEVTETLSFKEFIQVLNTVYFQINSYDNELIDDLTIRFQDTRY